MKDLVGAPAPWILVLFMMPLSSLSQNLTTKTSPSTLGSDRDKRFLGLFNVIQFSNSPCNTTENDRQGVCYTASECQNFGGRSSGECASGFGVCCIFEYSCDSLRSAPREILYFQSPQFPTDQTIPAMCLFGISVLNSNICQLRLDFESFSLDPGSTLTLPCDRDSFEILSTGMSDLGMGKLCGDNMGQHLYIPVLNGQSQPMLRVMTEDRMLNVSQGYKYSIKITQIDCFTNDPRANALRAPDNCLQYFMERRGTVQSFNWRPDVKRVYQKNQNYAICFRRSNSDCQMTLKRSTNAPPYSTSVGQITGYTKFCSPDNGCGFDDCQKALTGQVAGTVTLDHLQITGVHRSSTMPVTIAAGKAEFQQASFFCGTGLGADATGTTADGTDIRDGIIIQTKGPFVLRFVTDNNDGQPTTAVAPTPGAAQKINELGFSIDYQIQGICQNLDIGLL